MAKIEYHFNSLEDFLISTSLTVDGQLDDGWGAMFPVKGREIHATVLFADISGFSARTLDLSPTETLIFVNNFFAWISAKALRGAHGIVDKYIGDEIISCSQKNSVATIRLSRPFTPLDTWLKTMRSAFAHTWVSQAAW